jgi:hypothetical protein
MVEAQDRKRPEPRTVCGAERPWQSTRDNELNSSNNKAKQNPFSVLIQGFELRTSHLLDRHSSHASSRKAKQLSLC